MLLICCRSDDWFCVSGLVIKFGIYFVCDLPICLFTKWAGLDWWILNCCAKYCFFNFSFSCVMALHSDLSLRSFTSISTYYATLRSKRLVTPGESAILCHINIHSCSNSSCRHYGSLPKKTSQHSYHQWSATFFVQTPLYKNFIWKSPPTYIFCIVSFIILFWK